MINFNKSMETRKELYTQIQALNLKDAIKQQFNRHYTNVPTKDLIVFVNKAICEKSECTNTKNVKPIVAKCNCDNTKFNKLIEILDKKHILLKSEIDYINS